MARWAASWFLLLLLTVGASSAAAATPRTAPPSSPAAVDACGARAAVQARTADVERVVRGVGELGGCIADASGIAHMFVEWSAIEGDTHERICVDPPVHGGTWRCPWDTTDLTPGAYVVHMVAVDAAGNRGTSRQAYRVIPAPEPAQPASGKQSAPPEAQAEPHAGPRPQPKPQPETEQDLEPEPHAPAGPLDVTPPLAAPRAELVQSRVEECGRLELAPGTDADRALSIAVLECMRPALETAGAVALALDEIPVPPAVLVTFADAASLAAADELLPDRVGGVELELLLDPAATAETALAPAETTPAA